MFLVVLGLVSLVFFLGGKMASLTPGILLKLVKNVDDKEAKVVGEHRSALLQAWLNPSIHVHFSKF